MLIEIIGDTHFGSGYSFGKTDPLTGLNTRLLDYEKTLFNIITYAIEQKIELCVFLGDIFDVRNPPAHAVAAFYRQLIRLSAAKITTLILVGNHDQSVGRILTSSLDPLKELKIPYIHIFNNIDAFTFTDSRNETINVLLVPYRNRQAYDKTTNAEALNELRKEITDAKSKIDLSLPTFSCNHIMFEKTIPTDAGEYGLNELIVPFDMYDGIDINIAGHIHKSSILQESPAFIYSGSMECRDFSERDHQKCFLIYDSTKKSINAVSFKAIKTRKFVDFDVDYSSNFPEKPMEKLFGLIEDQELKDAVVRFNVKVPETKVVDIDLLAIRRRFYQLEVSCIADVSITPFILKHLRNQKINEAIDDVSAFKHFIDTQKNIESDVLDKGLGIIREEMEK